MFSRGRKKRGDDLEQHGTRALGTVLEVRTGGGVEWNVGNPIGDVGTSHAVRLKIRVNPAGEPPFEVEWKTRAQDGAVPEAGRTVVVWFDADDHDRFTVALDDAAAMAEEKFGEYEQRTGFDVGALIGNQDLFRDAMSGRPGTNPAEAVRNALNLSPQAIQRATPGAAPAATPEDRLEKLVRLRDQGALTQEEFESQKAKILDES